MNFVCNVCTSGEILLDELDCATGREGGLLECAFAPWKTHDCGDGEWAGVACKVQQDSCEDEEEFREPENRPQKCPKYRPEKWPAYVAWGEFLYFSSDPILIK